MTTAALLRKAKPVNVREAQAKLSQLISSKVPSLVLSHGKPVSFLMPYEEMLDLVEMLEELKDQKLLKEIAKARSEYAQGKSVSAERLFQKMRL
ncbi:MAG: hypothetical protein HZA21_01185 [Nitrospirae bacterium]|nr:hypothetical protein [Nitrospirota bacterium]